MAFRWEEDLRQSFVKNASPRLWCSVAKPGEVRSIIESTCSDGRADWVWANLAVREAVDIDPAMIEYLERPTSSRILAALRRREFLSMEHLFERAGIARKRFSRLVDEMIESSLILDGGKGSFRLNPAFRLPKLEICSFEFKLENWQRAFRQARRYRSFSHRVYVVMPSGSASRAMKHVEAFRRFNIGLISHDPEGASKRLILSRKRMPSNQSNFIQAVGILLRQVAKPARRANAAIPLAQLAK